MQFNYIKEIYIKVIMICIWTGGVGSAATQLAKTVKNVTVIGVASKEKHDFTKRNGVDYVFDYTAVIINFNLLLVYY